MTVSNAQATQYPSGLRLKKQGLTNLPQQKRKTLHNRLKLVIALTPEGVKPEEKSLTQQNCYLNSTSRK